MSQDKFVERHIGMNDQELAQMLQVIGVKSVEELISQVVPATIRLKQPLNLPAEGMSEYEFMNHIREISRKNKIYRSLIGMGYYGTASPAVILRNVFENPAWYTSYTPYQAEISQGRLEALLNFQTAVISLTGMEVSNCSLLDEATAAAEAMLMMFALRSREAVKEGRNVLFVDENIFPQTLDLLLTRSEPFGIEIISDRFDNYTFTGREFGAIVQYPAANGEVRDYEDFTAAAHSRGVLVTVAADILSLALLKAPGEWGADIVVGSTQRFGIPMGFGGPHAAYLATRDAYKRNMPGRIIGVSIDRLGNKALRMALQMREQHIKRERATSNICTAQALLATMAGFFAVYHGAEGIRRIALNALAHAVAVAEGLEKLGYELSTRSIFDTIEVVASAEKIRPLALEQKINFFYVGENLIRMSFDEVSNLAEVNTVLSIFAKAAGKKFTPLKEIVEESHITKSMQRTSAYLTEPVFKKYHSETDMMRYIKKLEHRDISLADSMISLGSCTMKLNPAVTMMPLSWAEFGNIHPFVPADQAEGYMEMINELSQDLATITGFAGVSLQPNSGATGEYSGLMTLPRELSLCETDEGYRLKTKPFGIDEYRAGAFPIGNQKPLLTESFGLLVQGNFGRIALKNSRGEEVVIEVTVDSITVDRSKSGDLSYFDDVDPKLFKKEDLLISTTKRYMRGNVNMEIIFDVSYLEIYADGGLETASVCVYPDAPYQVVSTDGDLEVKMYTIKK